MTQSVRELAAALSACAEAVCRRYLSHGRRAGAYWIIGDVFNTPGRSLYMHLRRGKWCDAALGEHGDLLDLIRLNLGLSLKEACAEARAFLALPDRCRAPRFQLSARDTAAIARQLFAQGVPVHNTLGEVYLRARGITVIPGPQSLRFLPKLAYREHREARLEYWPGLVVATRGNSGRLTGIQRTWLMRDGSAKAPLADPRRALGKLLGSAVRFPGRLHEPFIIGEGIETVLAIKSACPTLSVAAALSARHLAGFELPESLAALVIAADKDLAGLNAANVLARRAQEKGTSVRILCPRDGDFNGDLVAFGLRPLRQRLLSELKPILPTCLPAPAIIDLLS
jgi:phage/plasmid primase-like uncharacterized protein